MLRVIDFLADESGATAIEYGLIAALIGVAAMLTIKDIGTAVAGVFSTASTAIDSAQ